MMSRKDRSSASKSNRRRLRPRLGLAAERLEERQLLSAGDLVAGYGSGGVAVVDVPGPDNDDGRDLVAVQADGKLVMVGVSTNAARDSIAVARYNADGSLDATFDGDGIAVAPLAVAGQANAVALGPNGTIYVAGTANADFVVLRFNADGSLDSTFDGDGIAQVDMGSSEDAIKSIAVQPDGKVVAVGVARRSGTGLDIAVARFTDTGALDGSFGSGGKALVDMGSNGEDYGQDVALQAGGQILIAGYSTPSSAFPYLALVRLTTAGVVDRTFAGGGRELLSWPGRGTYGQGLVVRPDGGIVVGGYNINFNFNSDFFLAKFDASGNQDDSFGSGGAVVTDLNGNRPDTLRGVALQPDGKIVAAGLSVVGSANVFAVARYTAAGVLDGTFGTGGILNVALPNSTDNYLQALALQPDPAAPGSPRIILAGTTNDRTAQAGSDFALARVTAAGALDATFGVAGIARTNIAGPGFQGASDLVALPDGSTVAVGLTFTGPGRGLALAKTGADGALDPAFGTNGTASVAFPNINLDNPAPALARQGDKFIVAATGFWGGQDTVFVARFNADGSPDATFNGQGYAIAFGPNSAAVVHDVAVAADGTISVVGKTTGSSFTSDFFVAKFGADGAADASFGANGFRTYDFNSGDDEAYAIGFLPDGRMVVAGRAGGDFGVAMMFGNGSLLALARRDFGGTDYATALAIDGAGNVVVAGPTSSGNGDIAVARYSTANFSLTADAGFGTGGGLVTDIAGRADVPAGVAVQADQKVVVVGTTAGGAGRGDDFAVLRYTSGGQLDGTFGAGGIVTTDIGGRANGASAVAIRPDGKIVVAGQVDMVLTSRDFALALYDDGAQVDLAPTARAGGPYAVIEGGTVALDGRASSDPNAGTTLTYAWDLDGDGVFGEAGAGATRGDETGATPTFSAAGLDGPTDVVVSLRVTDPGGLSDTTTATIHVLNVGPQVSAFDGLPGYQNGALTAPEGSTVTLSVSATDPGGDAIVDYAWAVSREDTGEVVASGHGPTPTSFSYAVGESFGGYLLWSLQVTDDDGGVGYRQADIFVANAAPVVHLSGASTALAGQPYTLTIDVDDPSPTDQAEGFTYQINWYENLFGNDHVETIAATPGNGNHFAVTHRFDFGAPYDIQVVAIDRHGEPSQGTPWKLVQVSDLAPASLAQVIASTTPGDGGTTTVSLDATPEQVGAIVAAVNGLAPQPAPVRVVVNLGAGTYGGQTLSPPANVTLVIDGAGGQVVFVGHSPALTIGSGTVVITGARFTNDTAAPSLLVTGGSLTLRNSTVEESTTSAQAAVWVAGGAVDLGTAADPGGNTIIVHGPGELVHNATATPVSAVGTSFTINGLPLAPSSLSGFTFEDFNNDGAIDFGERPIVGVAVALDGTDFLGNPVHDARLTDEDGAYVFRDLRPGTYRLTEAQPAGYTQGISSIGTGDPGATVAGDRFDLYLAAGLNALNYNYGERPAAGGAIRHGQAAGIGFWNNKNGQALIKALNGGAGHQLGDWLGRSFPNMFGRLAGRSNGEVAAFFQSQFVVKGQKLDAQVLATALAVYVTNANLDDTGVGARYGFVVGGDGVGTATFGVGTSGAAFGVADGTVLTVMDLLLAADAQAVNGVLYGGNAARRTKANNVFSAINQAGGV